MAILLTKGFIDDELRDLHFEWHAHDFSASDAAEYERLADSFIGEAVNSGKIHCTKSQGDIICYDKHFNVFGVLSGDGYIRTFYKPLFCKNATLEQRQFNKCHKEKSHLDYVNKACGGRYKKSS